MTLLGRILLLLWFAPYGCVLGAAGPPVATAPINREFVSLESWARENGLQTRWLNRTDLSVRGRGLSLVFTVDAARFSLNSVYV